MTAGGEMQSGDKGIATLKAVLLTVALFCAVNLAGRHCLGLVPVARKLQV